MQHHDQLHHEDNTATQTRQCDSCGHVLTTVKSGDIVNPFTYDKKELLSIADGLVATADISEDLLDAHKHGRKALYNFINTDKTVKISF